MPGGPTIPADTDVLCEHCGYVLNGLPPGSNCPECGRPAADSDPALRTPTAWEKSAGYVPPSASGNAPISGTAPAFGAPPTPNGKPASRAALAPRGAFAPAGAFVTTSAAVLFRPTRFYRTLATRTDTPLSAVFAQIHWAAAALLLGLAAYAHAQWFIFGDPRSPLHPLKWLALSIGAYLFVLLTTRLAARLTHWEASYRSIRLTLPVVRRGLQYHAVHYLPVAVAAALTVVAYGSLVRRGLVDPLSTTTTYLYVLSAEVVIAAIYLFKTYWIAMRNMMYANA